MKIVNKKTKSMNSVQNALFVRKISNGGQSSSPAYIEIGYNFRNKNRFNCVFIIYWNKIKVEDNFGTKLIIEDVLEVFIKLKIYKKHQFK